jgi:hypothetical protein
MDSWTKVTDEWREKDTGICHYVLNNTATGARTGCIVGGDGHFLIHFSLGKKYPDLTLIEGREVYPSVVINSRMPVATSKTYALGIGNEIDPRCTYSDLMKRFQVALANGKAVLISGTEVK